MLNKSNYKQNKLSNRIQEMFSSGNVDETFINLNVNKMITNKLYKHQILHLHDLITSLMDNGIAIDGSGTGTGKTYTALALCKHFNLSPLIICPKSVINMWKDVCEFFQVIPTLIVNFETIKKGSEYNNLNVDLDDNDKQKRKKSAYLKIEETSGKFIWNVDKNKHIVIFDEAHKCKDAGTLNGKMLLSIKGKVKTLLLSATLADKADNFYVYGVLLNLFKTPKQCKTFVEDINKNGSNSMSKIKPLYNFLFPKYGSVMYLSEVETESTSLPKNIISALCYNISDDAEKHIQNQLEKIKSELEISKMLVARQQIELIKIPIIIELTNKYLEMGKSVVIFVNFLDTLDMLSNMLNTTCVVNGNQDIKERDSNIDLFQKNKSNLIICTLQTGGQSINLHDRTGHHPRASIIIPSFSSIDIIQALGRIHRTGTKSYCVQNLIFCANTYEENICKKIKNKISFLTNLTDDDFSINI